MEELSVARCVQTLAGVGGPEMSAVYRRLRCLRSAAVRSPRRTAFESQML
jgi:hypothetical protein